MKRLWVSEVSDDAEVRKKINLLDNLTKQAIKSCGMRRRERLTKMTSRAKGM